MGVPKEFFDGLDQTFDKKAEQDKQEREASSWEPEAGDQLKGIFLKVQYIDTQYGVKPLAIIRDVETGESTKIWLSSSVLQSVVDYQPAPGTPIGIRYEGWIQPKSDKGREYKGYTIVMPEDRTPEQTQAGYTHWREARIAADNAPVRDSDEIVARTPDDFKPF